MELNQTRIVLTGAASGIGRGLFHALSAYPVHLVAADIDQAAIQTAVESVPSTKANISPYIADLSQPDNVDALFDHALAIMGGIDLFIANAGYAYYEKIKEPDWQHIARVFQLNVFSAIYSAERMQALNGENPYKVVVTASSIGYVSLPGYAIYAATKAALHRFAEAYRYELANPQALMLVYPIATRTNFFDTAGNNVPVMWPNQPVEAVVKAIVRGIERDAVAVYPSGFFRLFRFFERFLPFLRTALQKREYRHFKQWLANLD